MKRERPEEEEDEHVAPTPPPSPSSSPPAKKQRLSEEEEEKTHSLEEQLFEWSGWDALGEFGDMVFDGIKLKDDSTGLKSEDIDCVLWTPSKSRVVFELKSGLNVVFPLKIAVQKTK